LITQIAQIVMKPKSELSVQTWKIAIQKSQPNRFTGVSYVGKGQTKSKTTRQTSKLFRFKREQY